MSMRCARCFPQTRKFTQLCRRALGTSAPHNSQFNQKSTSRVQKSNKEVQKLVSPFQTDDVDKIRNVGIMAHIDAGKTTTTERLLYYAGMTEKLGSVDQGSTVTDYLEMERQRGITIQSAAISATWRQHRINLIDTPGHIDFSYEVERALRVLDGAVAIIDASEGVETQTKTVWRQANNYSLPRVIFLNKMDKRGADVNQCLHSIRKELGTLPLLTQLNLGTEADFQGLVDLPTMQCLRWTKNSTDRHFETGLFSEAPDGGSEEAIRLRHQLIDELAELDCDLMEMLMTSSYDNITAVHIRGSLRKVTLASLAVPVLLGSSLRNVAVQPLLDAMVDYLPAPHQATHRVGAGFGKELCALAFKIVHEKERGQVTYVRLYNGSLKTGASVYNANQERSDKIGKIYTVLADQLLEIKSASAGSIVAVTGLDKTITGDTLLSGVSAMKWLEEKELPSLPTPDPVFMCSIEPYSSSQQRALDQALECLTKEDPSLRVKRNDETGDTVLMAMGELHLEVIKDRLLKEYGTEVYTGQVQISYRESIDRNSPIVSHTLENIVSDNHNHVSVSVSVESAQEKRQVTYVRSEEEDWTGLRWFNRNAINLGVLSALTSGPLLGYPVVHCAVNMHQFTLHAPRTSKAMISAAVYECVHKALLETGVNLSEPVMKLTIHCDEEHMGDILADLSQRRAYMESLVRKEGCTIITARSPVATLLGYSSVLRGMTSGRASMIMEVDGYHTMSQEEQDQVIQRIKGV